MATPKQIAKRYAVGFLLLIIFSAWWYFPGLQGALILDDEVNLGGLAQINTDNFWQEAKNFAFETTTRPLSLYSFALQAHYWPQAPAFKSINLAIHLLNACLIAWLLLLWGRLQQISIEKIQAPILLICAIWILSPIQISSVLYVVQRMAQLSVFFILLGLLLYSQGRYLCMQKRLLAGYSIASIGIGLMGILAILSKENGALLVVYASVLELTLFQNLSTPRHWKIWRAAFLYIPSMLLLILSFFYDYQAGYADREFNLIERLYTETRILWLYLFNVLLPLNQNFSLFNDGFIISRGLLQPWQTLLALAAWLVVIGVALWKRKHYPLYSFAVLWYLGGHSMESSVIPLQLYFEHRNYLPILAPIAALFYFLHLQWQQFPIKRRLLGFVGIWWLLFMLFISAQEIKLWKNPLMQAMYWAETHPQSRFAQSHAAALMVEIDQIDRAAAYYQHMREAFPNDSAPMLFSLGLSCYHPATPAPDATVLLLQLQHSRADGGALPALEHLYTQRKDKRCQNLLSANYYKQILLTLSQNPNWTGSKKATLQFILAQTYALEADYEAAIAAMDVAFQHNLLNPNDAKILKIQWLIQLKRYDEAMADITTFRQMLNFKDEAVYTPKLDKMQSLIEFVTN